MGTSEKDGGDNGEHADGRRGSRSGYSLPSWTEEFFAVLVHAPSLSAAAGLVGISRQRIWQLMRQQPTFRDQVLVIQASRPVDALQDWRAIFLACIERGMPVTKAAAAAGVTWSKAQSAKQRDALFSELWATAMVRGREYRKATHQPPWANVFIAHLAGISNKRAAASACGISSMTVHRAYTTFAAFRARVDAVYTKRMCMNEEGVPMPAWANAFFDQLRCCRGVRLAAKAVHVSTCTVYFHKHNNALFSATMETIRIENRAVRGL